MLDGVAEDNATDATEAVDANLDDHCEGFWDEVSDVVRESRNVFCEVRGAISVLKRREVGDEGNETAIVYMGARDGGKRFLPRCSGELRCRRGS